MRRAHFFNAVVVLSLVATRTAFAQSVAEPTGKNFHKIISLDSTELRGIATPPGGKWLAVAAVCSLTACSNQWGRDDGIWIVPTDGHAMPTRLLSAGHNDAAPAWFPSGDRLAFVSDRMSRDGSRKTYVMTVAIDPKTGRAVGPPRQISTDEAATVSVSPDGKWVAYTDRNDKSIKVVPATGGAARTVVKMPNQWFSFTWSSDGKALYFTVGERNHLVWYKASVSGGPATRAYENPDAVPYGPNTDMHVVMVRRQGAEGRGIKRVELYDSKERLVGTVDATTSDVAFHFPRGGMYATTSNRRYENYLLTLSDGKTRMLAASRFAWVDGWADDSTLTIDGHDSTGTKSIAGTLDIAGREHHVTLPADAGGCCGWEGVVGFNASFWRGGSVYALDMRTGAIQHLADSVIFGGVTGRGGFFSDGDRFLTKSASGRQVELRANTVDGRSTVVRAFAKSDSLVVAAVHGELVAWATVSRDSVTIFAARGPTGRPYRLTAQRYKPGRFFQLAWSFDATMLAITGLTADPPLSVIRVDQSGAPLGPPVVLNSHATEHWTLRWTPDNRSVVVTAVPIGARDEVVMRVPIDPKEAPTFYGRNDEHMFVSPDGKHVAYPATRTLGTTIWRVDFVPSGKVDLSGKP